MRMKKWLLSLFILFIIFALANFTSASSYNSNGTSGGRWGNIIPWYPNGMPDTFAVRYTSAQITPALTLSEVSKTLVEQDTSGVFKPQDGEQEVIGGRGLNYKRFAKTLPNGKTQYRIAAQIGPIHYKNNPDDANEHWKEINVNIQNVGGKEVVTKVPYYNGEFLDEPGYKITHKKTGDWVEEVLLDVNGRPFKARGKVQANKKIYRDVFTDTDFEVVATNAGMKGNLVLKSAQAPREFQFQLSSNKTGNKIRGPGEKKYKGRDSLKKIKFGSLNTLAKLWDENKDRLPAKAEPIPYDLTVDDSNILTVAVTPPADTVYPLTIDPTTIAEEQVGASSDDARNYGTTFPGDGNYLDTGTTENIGAYGTGGTYTYYILGARFTTIPIPQYATIDSATLSLMSDTSQSNQAYVLIYGEDADSAATYASTTHEPYDSYVSRTTNETAWSSRSNNISSWVAGTWYTSPDVSAIVQEVVDRASWANNNDLAFVITNNGAITSNGNWYAVIRMYDYSGNVSGPKFNATYTSPGTTRTWDGGGADGTCGGAAGDGNKWSCALNWSGDTLPATGDAVIFNNTSTKNATVDSGFTNQPDSVRVYTGYTGTITQAANLTLTGGLIINAGTWAISTYDLDNSATGHLNITGGTLTIGASTSNGIKTVNFYIGTSGTVTCSGASKINVYGDWTSINGTFTRGTSSIVLDPSDGLSTLYTKNWGNTTFYDLHTAYTGDIIDAVSYTYISNQLTLEGNATGSITSSIWAYIALTGSTANPVVSNGAIFSGTGGVAFMGTAEIPGGTFYNRVIVREAVWNTSRTLNLAGDITLNGSNNASLSVYGGGTAATIVTLDTKGYEITINGTNGDLYVGSSSDSLDIGKIVNTGTSDTLITVADDVFIYASGAGGDNTIDDSTGSYAINMNVADDWTNSDVATFTRSTVTLNGTTDQAITTNAQAFYNLTLNNTGASGTDDIIISGALDVNGLLTITDGDLDVSTNDPNVNLGGGLNFSHATNGSVDLSAYAGTWTFDGTGTWTDSGTTKRDIGTITINGSAITLTLGSSVKATKINLGADDTLNLGAGSYTLELDGTGTGVNIPLNITAGGTFNKGTGSTMLYSGSGAATDIATVAYNNLTFTPTSATTYTLTGNLTTTNALTGNLTISNANATLDVVNGSNYGITLAGSWTNSGTFTARSGTVTFNGTATGKTINPGSSSFYDLIFSGSGGAWSPLTNTVTVTNDLTMTAGTFDTSNGTASVTVNGNVAGTAGIINFTTTNTFTQNVSANKNFGTTAGTTAWTFNNLTFTQPAGPTPYTITTQTGGSGDITIKNTMTISVSGHPAFTFNAGNRTWHMMASGTPLSYSSLVGGNLVASSSTFSYENTTSATINDIVTFNNLQTSPASGTPTYIVNCPAVSFLAGTKVATANGEKNIEDIKVGDIVKSYDLDSNKIVLKPVTHLERGATYEYYIINGKTKVTGNHKFVLADNTLKAVKDMQVGDVLKTYSGSEPITKIDFILQRANIYDITVEGYHLFFADNYLVHNAGTCTLAVAGNFNLTGAGSATFDSYNSGALSYAAIDINGNLTIGANQTFKATTQTFTIGGDFSNSGTFTHNNGTVTFDTAGTTSNIIGTTTFYNLTCTTAGKTINFEAETPDLGNDRTNISNVLTLTGANGNNIILGRYGGSGSDQWAINPAGTKGGTPGWSVSYVTVSNSINLNSNYINPDNSTNGGNTTNWFSAPTLVKLVSFFGLGLNNKVAIFWQTASEYDNAGFNLYASENKNGPYLKLNSIIIAGLGTSTTGAAYSYSDDNVINGRTYYYKLEDVEFSGRTKQHGPIEAHPGLDSDSDGISDDWEIHYGLNPFDPTDASFDLDGDGLTNLEEFLKDKDPTKKDNEQVEEGLHIISQDATGIVAELITNKFEAVPKKIGRTIYQTLTTPGYEHGYTNEPGKPKMPLKVATLEIPQDIKCDISILDFQVKEYPGYNIYPMPGSALDRDLRKIMLEKTKLKAGRKVASVPAARKRASPKIKFYPDKNKEVYAQNAYYPADIVRLGGAENLRGQRFASINLYPLAFNPAKQTLKFYSQVRFKLNFSSGDVQPQIHIPRMPLLFYPKLKIWIEKEGLYRIGWNELWNAKFYIISQYDPRVLRLYNQGNEIAMRVQGEEDGIFNQDDYIEFYGEQNNSKYSKYNVYWLYIGQGNGKRMAQAVSLAEQAEDYPDRFKWKEHSEKNDFYWPERIGDENIDRWFQESYVWAGAGVDYPVNLKGVNLLHPQDKAGIKLAYYALFDVAHHSHVYLNAQRLEDALWQGQDEHILDAQIPQANLREGDNIIRIEALLEPGVDYDLYVPNYFEIEYWRNFIADQDKLEFSHKSVSGGITQFALSGFTTSDLKLFDITDALLPKYISGFQVDFQDGLYTLTFKYNFNAQEEKRFLALASDKAGAADSLRLDKPSNLASVINRVDYIIVYYGPFRSKLYPLLGFYRNNGLRVKLVDIEDVYDEFNYGISNPHAIKYFLRYAYQKWQQPAPAYVLLVGDAHYDYRDNLGTGIINFLPTYLIPNTPYLGETASDNWFVCLDADDDILPDMSIGRLPVRTEAETEAIVNKIIDYAGQPYADWNTKITLSADDETIFEDASDSMSQYIPGDITTTKLYLSDYASYPQFTQDLISNLNEGRLLLNYVGHGSTDLWTEEALFNTGTIGLLSNSGRYPFVASFDCSDGMFLHLDEQWQSLAEVFLRRQNAGAIACFSPSGFGLPKGHQILNAGLFKSIFTDGKFRLGAATTQAKIYLFTKTGLQYRDLIDTYILFGDPALNLKILLRATAARKK